MNHPEMIAPTHHDSFPVSIIYVLTIRHSTIRKQTICYKPLHEAITENRAYK